MILCVSYLLLGLWFFVMATYYPDAESVGFSKESVLAEKWDAFNRLQMQTSGPLLLILVMVCFNHSYHFAYSQTAMSREFQEAKISLLDTDACVYKSAVHHFGSYTSFEQWLEKNHSCSAARAFDIKITTTLVKDVFAFLGSVLATLFMFAIKKMVAG